MIFIFGIKSITYRLLIVSLILSGYDNTILCPVDDLFLVFHFVYV